MHIIPIQSHLGLAKLKKHPASDEARQQVVRRNR